MSLLAGPGVSSPTSEYKLFMPGRVSGLAKTLQEGERIMRRWLAYGSNNSAGRVNVDALCNEMKNFCPFAMT